MTNQNVVIQVKDKGSSFEVQLTGTGSQIAGACSSALAHACVTLADRCMLNVDEILELIITDAKKYFKEETNDVGIS